MAFKDSLLKKLICLILSVIFLAMSSGCYSQAISAVDADKVLASPGNTQAEKTGTSLVSPPKESTVPEGYRALCDAGTTYIAVGTGGRIDRINSDKTAARVPAVTNACLNDVISSNGRDVIVGDGGIILFSKNSDDFKTVKSGTKKSLFSVAEFQGNFWAVGEDGMLLRSNDGERWEPIDSGIKNNIISISANDRMCMALTREGQILMSADGSVWELTDYNVLYEGYSELFWFHSIRACGNAFVIAGEYQKNPGYPAVLSSETGEVWSVYEFRKINGEPGEKSFPLTINTVSVDWDQLVAACGNGSILTISECTECHKLDTLSSRSINDMVSSDGYLVLVGDGFWLDIRKSDAFRQYNVKAGQALKDYQNGAYIVDVRTDEEYIERHIKGAIHIPVDNIEIELEQRIPDKSRKLIFYCAKGVRAQTALEKALLMGYEKAYNLGGIGDWPYDTEAGVSSGGQ